MCGLGYPPTVYTQNDNECTNRLIKAEEDPTFSKKNVALLPYIERIRAEIKRQQDEQFLAVFGKGQYRLTEEFSFLQVEEKNFFRMSDRQKTATKKQFLSVSMSESRRRAEEALNTKRLSITAENSGIIEIPFPTLEGMFKKAADTTNDESLKIPAPEDANSGSSSKSTFLVHSKSSHEPHRVTVSTNGRVRVIKPV